MRFFASILAACLLLTFPGRAQEVASEPAPPAEPAAVSVVPDANGNPEIVTTDPLPREDKPADAKPERRRNNQRNGRSHGGHDVVQIRANATIKKGEVIDGDVVVIAGKLTMEGEVKGDVVAIASEAFIDGIVHGTVVVVPGPATFGPNADVRNEAVVVGASTRDPASKINRFKEVPIPEIVPLITGLKDFVFEGVVFMRPLPPSIRWVWLAHGAIFLVLLGLTVLFPKPVEVGAAAIANRPVVSIFSGFLTAILFLPLLVLLIISVVGIVAVPFAFVGLGLAAFFGKASVMAYLGQQIGRNLRVPMLEAPVAALLVGALVLAGLYMIPILGLLAWCVATLLGLGAIMVATCSALGSRTTSEPTPVGVPPAAAPVAYASMAGGASGAAADPLAQPTPASTVATAPVFLARVGFWKRLFATLLDWALLFIPTVAMHVFPPLGPLLLIAYFVAMWTWKGTTIGGICLGIKIVRTDGSTINFAVALVRSLASCFSFLCFFLGFFWAGWDREKQSWHDKIAGTVVVQVPKGVSLL